MRITSIAFAAVCLLPIGTVFGQQSGSGTAGSTKSALLAPNGFMYEGDCIDGRVFSGGPLVFKEQGDKLFVKIVGGAGAVRHRWNSLEKISSSRDVPASLLK